MKLYSIAVYLESAVRTDNTRLGHTVEQLRLAVFESSGIVWPVYNNENCNDKNLYCRLAPMKQDRAIDLTNELNGIDGISAEIVEYDAQ